MKTYNGKTVTKKHIEAVLRTENSTEIFRLYHQIYGGEVRKLKVYDFIREWAPTQRLARKASQLACLLGHVDLALSDDQVRKSIEFDKENAKHLVMQHFREEVRRGWDNYTKRPIMGHTYLYWVSPFYGHSDYNKSRALPIVGNERFCDLICRLADKYFPM